MQYRWMRPLPQTSAMKGTIITLVAALGLGASLIQHVGAQVEGNSLFEPTIPNRTPAPGPVPEGMVWIPGGEFSMGSKDAGKSACEGMGDMLDARPIHRVYVDGFWMDATDVTNEQFEKFVKATGYITIAERTPTKEEFHTALSENLVAGSTVFTPTSGQVELNDHYQWWSYVPRANWRHPKGPNTDLKGKEKYPVVQIAYPDAEAYAKSAGKRLPTEAEWEFAARGGLSGKLYKWAMSSNSEANSWQTPGKEHFQYRIPAKTASQASHR